MRPRDSGDGLDQRNDRVDINSRLAADAMQKLEASKPREHRRRFAPADRRQRQRRVLHHFNQHAAEPGHDHRAESIVAERPRYQFEPRLRHRLYGDALEPRVFSFGGEIAADAIERLAHLGFVAEIQFDAADVALVTHLGRQYFQYDRKADSRRRPHRLVSARNRLWYDDRQPERMQDPLALDFRENRPSARTRGRNYR